MALPEFDTPYIKKGKLRPANKTTPARIVSIIHTIDKDGYHVSKRIERVK